MSAPKLTKKPAELLPVPRILKEVSRRIVGQDAMVERLLIGLLTGGHILLEGVPGLAKTLAVRTLAEIIHASFSRIQFTPDLLPADVIGTMVFNQKSQEFHVKKGPLFAQIILADEINRAPAKVQAALLEGMQEHQVTIGGTTYPLEEPFMVLATQNPIESEGTYPLPEAQLDRFMLKVRVGYPSRDEEKEVLLRMSGGKEIAVERLLDPDDNPLRPRGHRRPLHGPEGGGLHRRPGPGHPRSWPRRAHRSQAPGCVRWLASRIHRPGPGRAGPCLPSRPGVRHPGGRARAGTRRPAPSHRAHVRGRSRGRDHRRGRAPGSRRSEVP